MADYHRTPSRVVAAVSSGNSCLWCWDHLFEYRLARSFIGPRVAVFCEDNDGLLHTAIDRPLFFGFALEFFRRVAGRMRDWDGSGGARSRVWNWLGRDNRAAIWCRSDGGSSAREAIEKPRFRASQGQGGPGVVLPPRSGGGKFEIWGIRLSRATEQTCRSSGA